MAKLQANVYLTIWADPDFLTLPPNAKLLYFTLLTHPTLDYCGVADWRENRLSTMTGGLSVEELRHAAWELGQRRMIAVDPDTEEVLVRSFVRHDGGLKQPNIAKGTVREYGAIMSLKIRELVTLETRRAVAENPEWKGVPFTDPITKQFPDSTEYPSDLVPEGFQKGDIDPSADPSCDPTPNPSSNPSVDPKYTSTSTSTTTRPNGRRDANELATPAPKKKRATQLPQKWEPNEGHRKLANELGLDLKWEGEDFADKAVAKGWTYVNWDRAFNGWLRNARKYADRDGTQPVAAEQVNSRKLISAWRERYGHPPVPQHLLQDDPATANRWAQAFMDAIGQGHTDQQASTIANQTIGRKTECKRLFAL